MSEISVLIVEDDPVTAGIHSRIVEAGGYRVQVAEHGRQALDLFAEQPFSVVITDLQMPVMDGREFIDQLGKKGLTPIVIVLTANADLPNVIETMKMHVYDYLIKPVNADELLVKLEHVAELIRLRSLEKSVEMEYELRLQHQLSINAWKEDALRRDLDRFDQNLFTNLKRSLSQGAGFGLLLSLISMLGAVPEKEGRYYIDGEMMDVLKSNAEMARRALQVFEDIEALTRSPIGKDPILFGSFHLWLEDLVSDLEEFSEIRGHRIVVADLNPELSGIAFPFNRDHMRTALHELFMNAFKFSRPESDVFVLFSAAREKARITFINSPVQTDGKSIVLEPDYHRIVFDPFFRLMSVVDERYGTLDFGLGLTLVNKIIKGLGGTIFLMNIKDHSGDVDASEEKISVQIELPCIEHTGTEENARPRRIPAG